MHQSLNALHQSPLLCNTNFHRKVGPQIAFFRGLFPVIMHHYIAYTSSNSILVLAFNANSAVHGGGRVANVYWFLPRKDLFLVNMLSNSNKK